MTLKKRATRTAVIALALGSALTFTQPAAAGSGAAIGIYGANGSIIIRDGGYHGGHYRGPYPGARHYEHRQPHPYRHARECHPRKALRIAEDKGVRGAHVERIGKRLVIVEGRGRRGADVRIGFKRDSHHCEIAWVERKKWSHGYRY